MPGFPALTPSPNSVHPRSRELCGHHPHWRKITMRFLFYTGHYRVCSYCDSIHPGDMIGLLRQGFSRLEATRKEGKRLFLTPNIVAGCEIKFGSLPIDIFEPGHPPATLTDILKAPVIRDSGAGIAERLARHMEFPRIREAPDLIEQPFFMNHTTDEQWREILDAIAEGDQRNGKALQGSETH